MNEPNTHQILSFEIYAWNSSNDYQQMVDGKGQPYFNIFWTDPAEAAHDWPDFADVTARQLQAVIMLRLMTGIALPIEQTWYQNILSLIEPDSGLIGESPYQLSRGSILNLFLDFFVRNAYFKWVIGRGKVKISCLFNCNFINK